MAYTVRTDSETEKLITAAKTLLDEKSATKALVLSCELLPIHLEKIESLEFALENMTTQYNELIVAIDMKEAANNILRRHTN